MIVRTDNNHTKDISKALQGYAFCQDEDGTLPLTKGKYYVVSGIRQIQDHTFYLVCRDEYLNYQGNRVTDSPWWFPASLFSTIDATQPDDWIEAHHAKEAVTSFPELVEPKIDSFEEQLEDGEASAMAIFQKHYQQYYKLHEQRMKDHANFPEFY